MDIINEGIHINNIAGVIMLRITSSPIIYSQQVGRALSAGGKREPLIFDVENNYDSLARCKNTAYKLEIKYIKMLSDIHMDWMTSTERKCEQAYSYADDYYEMFGDIDIPGRYSWFILR